MGGLVISLLEPNRFGLNRPAAGLKTKANFRRRSAVGVAKILQTQRKPKWGIILIHPHGIFETHPNFLVLQIEALLLFVTVVSLSKTPSGLKIQTLGRS